MYKLLLFLKRRPGMTVEDFRAYYENHHVPLCMKYMRGVDGYTRRFIDPVADARTGAIEEMPFDVITELWFKDPEVFRATVERFAAGQVPDEILNDELKLFDREKSRISTLTEYGENFAS